MLTKKNLLLSKSVIIKFKPLADHINKRLLLKGYSIPDDKRDWKYYLNISGQKHITNSDVRIKVTETGEELEYSLETLKNFPYTAKELLKYSNMYLELIEKYPNDLGYIKGCLHPVDIDVAIAAEDCTILNYNETFIEDNEYNLIPELETYISNFVHRWVIINYSIVEELYVPSCLGALYATIPGKINNIRLNNINTSRVHSFYLEHFFRSRLYLWDDVKLLNKESQFWLYSNLDTLIKNVGKNRTLELISENVFDSNGVGLGTYVIQQTTPDYNPDAVINDPKLPYDEDRYTVITRPLNKSYSLDNGAIVNIDSITQLQLIETDPLSGLVDNQLEKSKYYSEKIKNDIRLHNLGNFNSKIIDISTDTLYKLDSESLLDKMLNIWCMLVDTDSYVGMIDYTDPNSNNGTGGGKIGTAVDYMEPNTNQSFTISPKVGLLMLIKLLLVTIGKVDSKLSYLKYFDILDSGVSADVVISELFPDGYSGSLIKTLESYMPKLPTNIVNPNDFKNYAEDAILFSKMSWVLDGNSGNDIVSTNIKQYLNRVTMNGKLKLSDTPKTIDELLAEHDVVYDVKNNYDVTASIRSLIEAFTLIKVDEYEEIRNKLVAYKNIVNKLTSYTIQVLDRPDDVNNESMIYNSTSRPFVSKKGLITPLSGITIPLEDVEFRVEAYNNDFRDEVTKSILDDKLGWIHQFVKPDGACYVFHGVGAREIRPNNYIHISNKEDYTILGDEFVDKFFVESAGSVEPLEDSKYEFGDNGSIETLDGHIGTSNGSKNTINTHDTEVTGFVLHSNNTGISLVKPKVSVFIEDDE